MLSPRATSQGFTLIELMIVVAIIGILAAIAIPAYGDYVRRGQMVEVTNQLTDMRTRLEQFYLDNRNYGTGTTCGNNGSQVVSFAPTDARFFNYVCTAANSAQTYVITATGIAGRVKGDVYTINQNSEKTTTKFKGQTVNKTCWLVNGSEC